MLGDPRSLRDAAGSKQNDAAKQQVAPGDSQPTLHSLSEVGLKQEVSSPFRQVSCRQATYDFGLES